MMSVLHARESIHRINEVAYAFGSMKQYDGRQFVNELQRLAAGTDATYKPARPKSMEELAKMMGGVSGVSMRVDP